MTPTRRPHFATASARPSGSRRGLEGQTGVATDALGKWTTRWSACPCPSTMTTPTASSIRRGACGSMLRRSGFPHIPRIDARSCAGQGARLDLLLARRRLRASSSPAGSGRRHGRPGSGRNPRQLALLRRRGRLGARLRLQQSRTRPPRGALLSAVAACSRRRRELRIKVTDTIGIVPFFDAGNAFASSFPNFSQPSTWPQVSGCAIIPRSARSASTSPFRSSAGQQHAAGRGLCQHRAGILMARRRSSIQSALGGAARALVVARSSLLCAPAARRRGGQGRPRQPDLAGAVVADDRTSRSARSTACCPPTRPSATSCCPIATGRGSRSTRSGSSGTGSRCFSRRLEVDQLTIDHMQFLRRPLPAETPPPRPTATRRSRSCRSCRSR